MYYSLDTGEYHFSDWLYLRLCLWHSRKFTDSWYSLVSNI